MGEGGLKVGCHIWLSIECRIHCIIGYAMYASGCCQHTAECELWRREDLVDGL